MLYKEWYGPCKVNLSLKLGTGPGYMEFCILLHLWHFIATSLHPFAGKIEKGILELCDCVKFLF